MAELNGHNTRKSQFLVIACIMPIFVFSNDFTPFHTGKEDLLNKEKIKITSIGKANPDSLSPSEAKVFYSTLFAYLNKVVIIIIEVMFNNPLLIITNN